MQSGAKKTDRHFFVRGCVVFLIIGFVLRSLELKSSVGIRKPIWHSSKLRLNNLLAGIKKGDTILFLIDRGGTTIFVTLNVKK